MNVKLLEALGALEVASRRITNAREHVACAVVLRQHDLCEAGESWRDGALKLVADAEANLQLAKVNLAKGGAS